MLERLQGLDDDEQTACLIAESTLGAIATAYDVAPKQGTVDAFLDYPDGRRGAFEVTQLATDEGKSFELESLLKQDGFGWPLPGKWWWTIKIEDPAVDLRRLRNIYPKIILVCESVGVKEPRRLPLAAIDDDVRWLVEKSSVRMQGYPNVPAADDRGTRRATIDRLSTWGGSDEIFSQLNEALSTAFDTYLIQRHLDKLRRTQADSSLLWMCTTCPSPCSGHWVSLTRCPPARLHCLKA